MFSASAKKNNYTNSINFESQWSAIMNEGKLTKFITAAVRMSKLRQFQQQWSELCDKVN